LRWKLLVLTSLAAAIVGAGSFAALAQVLPTPAASPRGIDLLLAATLLAPLAASTYAVIFVYRHTARRRKLQAALTALLSLLLTVGAFLLYVRTYVHHD
jgi:hypothetical protein